MGKKYQGIKNIRTQEKKKKVAGQLPTVYPKVAPPQAVLVG
jgi:hypothetical protein